MLSRYIYKHRLIQNIIRKPLLHKKGKKWIVLGLSALVLLGFGGIRTASANTVNHPINNQIHTAFQAKQPQSNVSSNSSKTTKSQSTSSNVNSSSASSSIQKQAKNLHQNIIGNQFNHKVASSHTSNQSKIAQNDKVIDAGQIINTKPVSNTGNTDNIPHINLPNDYSNLLGIEFYSIDPTQNPFATGETYSDVLNHSDSSNNQCTNAGNDAGISWNGSKLYRNDAQSDLNDDDDGIVGSDYDVILPGQKYGSATIPMQYKPQILMGNMLKVLCVSKTHRNINFMNNQNHVIASDNFSLGINDPKTLLNDVSSNMASGKSISDAVSGLPNSNQLKQQLKGYSIKSQSGLSANGNMIQLTVSVQKIVKKTDNFIFVHGESENSPVVKKVTLSGTPNSSVDVSNLIPSQYNVNDGTKFTYDGKTHYVYLGIGRPNNRIITPANDVAQDTITFINDNKIIKTVNKNGISQYDINYNSDIPTGYQVPNAPQIKYNNQNHVIEVAKNNNITQYGTITVNYVDSNNRIIGNSLTLNGASGSSLNNNYFMQSVPVGYHYIGSNTANNNVKFNNSNQTVQFEVAKNSNPIQPQAPQYGTIKVSYIDNNGTPINQSLTLAGKNGSNFDSNYFMNNIPSGYHYVSQIKGNNVTSFNNGSQQVQFKVAKNSSNSTVINHYIPGKIKVINHTIYVPKYIPKIIYKKHNIVINHVKYVPKIVNHNKIIYVPKTIYKYNNKVVYIPKIIDHDHTIYVPKIIYKDNKQINNNRIIYKYKHYPRVDRLNNVKEGHTVRYHNNLITRLHINGFKYFYITKTILAHRNLASIGNIKDYDYVLHPNHIHTFKINRMWLINHKNHFSIRYQFTYHGKTYFTTANQDYTRNAYYQPREFGSHTHNILITNNCIEYNRSHYSRKSIVKNHYRGEILRIKKVIYINSHYSEMTRFELNNGHYITANKNYVKIIK